MTGQPPVPAKEADEIRSLIDSSLLNGPPTCVSNLFLGLTTAWQGKGKTWQPWVANIALEYWWHLARIGAVAIPGGQLGTYQDAQIPELILTERGRKWLELGEKSPHYPPKYLGAVCRRVVSPDEIVMTYLDEAVGAWVAQLHRASAVMLGCACERLVLMLAGEIAGANLQPWSAKLEKKLKGEIPRISDVFEVVRSCLTQMPEAKKLPGSLGDALDRKLSAIFDHARGLRNKSGHPTGEDVSAEDAEAGLLMFPGFYALVDELCRHLREGRTTGANQ